MARILVVDDDRATRQIIATTVEQLGHQFHLCSDGMHALDALQCNDDFGLLVTDISMPVMDGRQLIEMVRRDPVLPDLPIVIMSGVVGIKEISDLMKRGASRFLPKPFTVGELTDAINNCLELKLGVQK